MVVCFTAFCSYLTTHAPRHVQGEEHGDTKTSFIDPLCRPHGDLGQAVQTHQSLGPFHHPSTFVVLPCLSKLRKMPAFSSNLHEPEEAQSAPAADVLSIPSASLKLGSGAAPPSKPTAMKGKASPAAAAVAAAPLSGTARSPTWGPRQRLLQPPPSPWKPLPLSGMQELDPERAVGSSPLMTRIRQLLDRDLNANGRSNEEEDSEQLLGVARGKAGSPGALSLPGVWGGAEGVEGLLDVPGSMGWEPRATDGLATPLAERSPMSALKKSHMPKGGAGLGGRGLEDSNGQTRHGTTAAAVAAEDGWHQELGSDGTHSGGMPYEVSKGTIELEVLLSERSRERSYVASGRKGRAISRSRRSSGKFEFEEDDELESDLEGFGREASSGRGQRRVGARGGEDEQRESPSGHRGGFEDDYDPGWLSGGMLGVDAGFYEAGADLRYERISNLRDSDDDFDCALPAGRRRRALFSAAADLGGAGNASAGDYKTNEELAAIADALRSAAAAARKGLGAGKPLFPLEFNEHRQQQQQQQCTGDTVDAAAATAPGGCLAMEEIHPSDLIASTGETMPTTVISPKAEERVQGRVSRGAGRDGAPTGTLQIMDRADPTRMGAGIAKHGRKQTVLGVHKVLIKAQRSPGTAAPRTQIQLLEEVCSPASAAAAVAPSRAAPPAIAREAPADNAQSTRTRNPQDLIHQQGAAIAAAAPKAVVVTDLGNCTPSPSNR